MIIDTIREFIKLNQEKYEAIGISPIKLEDIIRSPFKFIKVKMNDETFPTIRIKYFGSFRIFRGSAKGFLKKQKIRCKKEYITEEELSNFEKQLETKVIKDV